MTNLEKTQFMNKKTFSEDEIKNYPYNERRTFSVAITSDEDPDGYNNIEVYAVDEQSLCDYLKTVYNEDAITCASEKVTEYIEIDLSDYL